MANLDGEPVTIVGVMSASVGFPSREVGIWEPLRLDPTGANPYNARYGVIGRLRPRVTLDDARRDLTVSVRAVGKADRRLEQTLRIVRRGRSHELEPRRVKEPPFRTFGMEWSSVDTPAKRCADDHRHCGAPPIVILGRDLGDLIEGA